MLTTAIRLALALVLIGGGIVTYVWNEQISVDRYRDYQAKVGKYIRINGSVIDPKNEGKYVYFTTTLGLKHEEWLHDPQLGVRVKNAIALMRNVLMYEWVEKVTKDASGKKQVSYEKAWTAVHHDSKNFLVPDATHENPPQIFRNQIFVTYQPVVGAFKVSEMGALARSLGSVFVNYPFLMKEYLDKFPEEWQSRIAIKDDRLSINMGNSSRRAEVGDTDVFYKVLPVGTVITVVGKQTGATIAPVERVVSGDRTLDDIRGHPLRGMELDVWHYREGSAFIIFFGFSLALFALGARKAGANAVRHGGYLLGALSGSVMLCGIISGFYWKEIPSLAMQVNIAAGVAALVFLVYLFFFFYGIPGRRNVATSAAGSVLRPAPMPQVSPVAAEPQIVVPPAAPLPPSNPGTDENRG